MTLAKLLKEKNLLVARIAELKARIQRENVTEGDNVSKYENKKIYAELLQAIDNLVLTKTLISQLNIKVVDKIYRMGELKGQIQFLRSINTQEGNVTQRGWNEDKPFVLVYTSQIDRLFVDAEIERFTEAINDLQEELDVYNHSAKIEG